MILVKRWTGTVPPGTIEEFELEPGVYTLVKGPTHDPSVEGILYTSNGSWDTFGFVYGGPGEVPIELFDFKPPPFTFQMFSDVGSGEYDVAIYSNEEPTTALADPEPVYISVDRDDVTTFDVELSSSGEEWPPDANAQVNNPYLDWLYDVDGFNITITPPDTVDCGTYTFEVRAVASERPSSQWVPLDIQVTGCEKNFYVYELEKGWTFDGMYIPHYLELNWLFNEDPFTYHEMQKVRIHGLTKGNVDLQVAMSGMQGDMSTDYLEDYTEPQFIDLPFTPIHISEDYRPTTNYTDVVSRGIGIQMKFEGRNTDPSLPEPAHVIQVLALQASPQGNGKRAN